MGGYTHVIDARDTGRRDFALHRKKSPGEHLNRINETTGEIEEVATSSDGATFADSSMIRTLGDMPAFLITGGGGTGAPRAGRFTDWLRTAWQPEGHEVTYDAVPVTERGDQDLLERADGARSVTIRVPMGSLGEGPDDLGQVAASLRKASSVLTTGWVELSPLIGEL